MRGLTITPAVLGLIGVALLVFESVQAMRSVVLGTVGTALLFAGLGLIVVAAVLLVAGVRTGPRPDEASDDAAALGDVPATVPPAATTAAAVAAAEPDVAASWTALCRAECAGRLDAGELHESVRRGATLVVFEEGVLIDVGKTQQHRSWTQLTAVAALLGGNKATITVQYDGGDGDAEAAFTGKNGDLAPVATALVSAAPAQLVDVTYS